MQNDLQFSLNTYYIMKVIQNTFIILISVHRWREIIYIGDIMGTYLPNREA